MLGYKSLKQFLRPYIFILGAAIIGFFVRMAKYEEFGFEYHVHLTWFSAVLMSLFWEALRFTNYWLNKVFPFERNITGRIIIQLFIGVIIGLIVRTVIYKWGEPHIPFEVDKLFLAATWVIYAVIPVGVNLGFFTIYFIERWKESLVKAERLEKEKSQVQFDNLKNQLNPHFLFNALTSLNSLIFENQELASAFLQQLSKVFRYLLQHKDKNIVLLKTELEFISHYVNLLETRFQGALKINFEVSEEAKERSIVPVTLQILIENAIKHNILDKDKKLVVEIMTMGDYLIMSNNLQAKKNVETSNKQGLENLKSVYKFLTDKPVLIEPTDDRFFVKIPLI